MLQGLMATLFYMGQSLEILKQNVVERDYAEEVLVTRKIKGHVCLVAGYIALICHNSVTTQNV
jgi:hypothetical protein